MEEHIAQLDRYTAELIKLGDTFEEDEKIFRLCDSITCSGYGDCDYASTVDLILSHGLNEGEEDSVTYYRVCEIIRGKSQRITRGVEKRRTNKRVSFQSKRQHQSENKTRPYQQFNQNYRRSTEKHPNHSRRNMGNKFNTTKDLSDVKCYNCNEPGHYARNFPRRAQRRKKDHQFTSRRNTNDYDPSQRRRANNTQRNPVNLSYISRVLKADTSHILQENQGSVIIIDSGCNQSVCNRLGMFIGDLRTVDR